MQLEPRNPFLSPRFGQIATFMLLPAASSPAGLDVALIGVPYDGGTSYRPGARFGPRAVREQSSLIRTWNPVLKVHPFQRLRVADCGDIDVVPISIERTFEAITAKMDEVVAAGAMPLCVGGDHSVTLPILRSVARRHGPLGIVHFDAHPDTWDEYFGSKFFHGTPFRRGVEEGLIDPRRMIQVGIRGPLYGPEDFAFHDQHGIEVVRIEAVKEQGTAWVAERFRRLGGGPVYCSFDIDAVDPAFAPGTGTPEVGGLTSCQALIIELDTPGGLERSMRGIVQRMLNAELPVIVYVAPTGARAASAGVFITMAAHVAAMAPATNIGAAHPVALSGGVDKESMKKIENDAAAFIRTVALERGRNADWAEKAVRQSVSITEREAVQLKVVDLIAASVPELLDKIDGRTVKTIKGPRTLATRGAPVKPIEIGFRDRVLNVITDPNVAYILMMLGTIGLLAELYNPGAIFPGVVGAISIILAFFAFQSLPINYAGLLLILLGLTLLIAEIKFVSHGVLAIGGVVAMGLGSLMLFDAPEASGLRISWSVIIMTVGATAGLFLFVITAGVRAFARRPLLGVSGLVGETAVARGPLAPQGQVAVHCAI